MSRFPGDAIRSSPVLRAPRRRFAYQETKFEIVGAGALKREKRNGVSFVVPREGADVTEEDIATSRHLLESAEQVKTNAMADLKKMSDIDMEFHGIIYNASGNKQLKEMIESLLYKMSMYWFQVGFSAAEFREQFDELAELLRAIEKREPKNAKEIMKRHIDHFSKVIKENIF